MSPQPLSRALASLTDDARLIGAERQIWRAHICRFPFGEPAGYPVGRFR